MLIDLLDRVLTRLFATRLAVWIAVHVFHIPAEKCSLCYTRVRWAQFMLWLTQRGERFGWLHDKRITWKVRANPLPDGFNLSQLTALATALPAGAHFVGEGYVPAAPAPREPVDYLKLSELPSAANIQIPPYYLNLPLRKSDRLPLWWPRTSEEERERYHIAESAPDSNGHF